MKKAPKQKLIVSCKNCGRKGEPKVVVRGNTALEVLLYLFFLVPGIIYTIWRCSGYTLECPKCANKNVIKEDERMEPSLKQKTTFMGWVLIVFAFILVIALMS